jgi:hypothetical protein
LLSATAESFISTMLCTLSAHSTQQRAGSHEAASQLAHHYKQLIGEERLSLLFLKAATASDHLDWEWPCFQSWSNHYYLESTHDWDCPRAYRDSAAPYFRELWSCSRARFVSGYHSHVT